MTQRQHDTRVALRRAVAIFGTESDDTRVAAIQFCYAHGIDPHWRYPLQTMIDPNPPGPIVRPTVPPVEEEWQRVLKRFVADDA
jgi:hypothetical protein